MAEQNPPAQQAARERSSSKLFKNIREWAKVNSFMLSVVSGLITVAIVTLGTSILLVTRSGSGNAWMAAIALFLIFLWCVLLLIDIFKPVNIVTVEAEKKEVAVAQVWESWLRTKGIIGPGRHLQYNKFPFYYEIIKVSRKPRTDQFPVKDVLCNTASTQGGLEESLPDEGTDIPPGGGYVDVTVDVTWSPGGTRGGTPENELAQLNHLIEFIEIGQDGGVKSRLQNRIETYTRSIGRGANHLRMAASPISLANAMWRRVAVITRDNDRAEEERRLELLRGQERLPKENDLGIVIIEVKATATATGKLKEDNEGYAREQAQRSRDMMDLQTAVMMTKELQNSLATALGVQPSDLDYKYLLDFVQVQMKKAGGYVFHANKEAGAMIAALGRIGFNVKDAMKGQQGQGGGGGGNRGKGKGKRRRGGQT